VFVWKPIDGVAQRAADTVVASGQAGRTVAITILPQVDAHLRTEARPTGEPVALVRPFHYLALALPVWRDDRHR